MRKMKINNIWYIALLVLLPPFVISSDEPREASYDMDAARDDHFLPMISCGVDDFASNDYEKLFVLLGSGLGVGPYAQMQVVYTWIPSYCLVNKGSNKKCKKNFEKKVDFSIHGLWPADKDGNTLQPNPNRPCKEPPDMIQQLKRLQRLLLEAMPSISDQWIDFQFWRYQWQMHGCLQNSLDVEPYFKVASNQWTTTDLLSFLKDANPSIIPSQTHTYTKDAIKNAIQTKIGGGVAILISCKTITEGPAQVKVIFLYEIYVCVNQAGKIKVACNALPNDEKGCGNGRNIRLPPAYRVNQSGNMTADI